MRWGHRRWQNEDGSLTPEGREHYGYGQGRDKKAAKFEKYTSKQHDRIDKRYSKVKYRLDSDAQKAYDKFKADPSDKNRAKLEKALKRAYNTKDLMNLEHERVDALTLENYKKDKYANAGNIVKGQIFRPLAYTDLVKAVGRGFMSGSTNDAAKFMRRISDYDYNDISTKNAAKAKEFIDKADKMNANLSSTLEISTKPSHPGRYPWSRDNYGPFNPDKIQQEAKPGKRTYEQYEHEQARLHNVSPEKLSSEIVKLKTTVPKSGTNGQPYWETYSQGSKEYKSAQKRAQNAETTVFRAEDAYSAALERYGKDSTITQAAKKKYQSALGSFESQYGYTPQEFD